MARVYSFSSHLTTGSILEEFEVGLELFVDALGLRSQRRPDNSNKLEGESVGSIIDLVFRTTQQYPQSRKRSQRSCHTGSIVRKALRQFGGLSRGRIRGSHGKYGRLLGLF